MKTEYISDDLKKFNNVYDFYNHELELKCKKFFAWVLDLVDYAIEDGTPRYVNIRQDFIGTHFTSSKNRIETTIENENLDYPVKNFSMELSQILKLGR